MQTLKKKLPEIVVSGIPTINRAVIQIEDEKTSQKSFHLIVEGYGLKEVMKIPGILSQKTYTNHIMEMEKVLGIEAAYNSICYEIQYVMQVNFKNYQYIFLISKNLFFLFKYSFKKKYYL